MNNELSFGRSKDRPCPACDGYEIGLDAGEAVPLRGLGEDRYGLLCESADKCAAVPCASEPHGDAGFLKKLQYAVWLPVGIG